MINKIKAIKPHIVTQHGAGKKPYYGIEYYDIADNKWHFGYGSYSLENVEKWLSECFIIVSL